MNRFFALRALALSLSLLGVTACKPTGETSSAFPRPETLYVGRRQWGEPSTFNPLEGQASWPLVGYDGSNLLYEPQPVFNPLEGKVGPLPAASYEIQEH